jgi:putative two-component system response regulator
MLGTGKDLIEINEPCCNASTGGLEPWAVEAYQILHVDSAYPQLHRFNEDFAKIYHERENAVNHLNIVRQEVYWRMALAIAAYERKSPTDLLQVGVYAALLAKQMGCKDDYCADLQQAAMLIDIGMLGIANEISPINRTLTEQEKARLQMHTVIGADMLGAGVIPEFKLAAEVALSHCEMFDGAGYPSQLRGLAIPLSGRIVAVAEYFHELTSNTNERPGLSAKLAAEMIRSDSGCRFDPKVVYALEELLSLFSFAIQEFARIHISKAASAPDAHYWEKLTEDFLAQSVEPRV